MDWFRVYNSIKDDPKILQFTPENRWFFVAILAVSSEQPERGTLPSAEILAISLRLKEAKVRALLRYFVKAGLLDEDVKAQRLVVHGWNRRQRKTDDVAARVAKHRETHPTRTQERTCNVTDLLPHACATDTETETETENTPLYPPVAGGTYTPRVVAPSGDSGDVDPMAERHRVSDLAAERWGPQGLDTAESLLNQFPPASVAYAAEQTFASFGRTLDQHAMRTWRKICREHPEGPPPPRQAAFGPGGDRSDVRGSRASPAGFQRPLTDHQRKRAKIAEMRRAYDDAEAEHEGLGVEGDDHAHGPAQPARRA